MRIFISHRTQDEPWATAFVEHALIREFGEGNVFRDVHGITAGADYPKKLLDALGRSDVVLVLVGPQWLTIERNGGRMLENADDWVRREITMALDLGKRVVPVLLDRTAMPTADQLPEEIRDFAFKQRVAIGSLTSQADIHRLIGELRRPPDGHTEPKATEAAPSTFNQSATTITNIDGDLHGEVFHFGTQVGKTRS